MCERKELFVELSNNACDDVSLGDSSKLVVEGKEKIKIFQKIGTPQYISNVYYVPNMKSNILNIGQLLDKGYTIHMKDRILSLLDKRGRYIAYVEMSKNRMFPLHLKTELQKCFYGLIENE